MTVEADHNPQVILAAQWLAELQEPPTLAVPTIRQRFSLSAKEACDACALARKYRTARRAFG